ncbi:dihydrolipoamide acetyltransferase family protein [Nocardioides sp.]|uniref:dihydrolipoamide acetyltransferase family protein n=1 Tax=Nocardioides sp. TaxID=35761 RepID=UPI0035130381
MPEYLLPDVGEGLTEAEIVTWRVAVGDVVAINDVVVEIETAKSVVELPSPFAGEVTALLVAEGELVTVGTPIIAIGAPVAAPAPSPSAAPAPALEIDLSNPAASGGGEGESLVGRNKAERGAVRRARRAPALVGAGVNGTAPPAVVPTPTPAPPAGPAELRVLATPPVRKLARDHGVDLRALTPTGPRGTVSRADVEAALAHPVAPTAPAQAPVGRSAVPAGPGETREPVKGVRRAMAQAMTASAFTVPHVTVWTTLDVTATVELVARLREHRDLRDVRVSPLLVVAKAVLLALRRHPLLNSRFDTGAGPDGAGEVVLREDVNLGIAAATPRGLLVPQVKGAHRLGLADLARELADLVATARAGTTPPAAMVGGTFTITNVGVFGMEGGTPIITPGESAILCVGAIEARPWVVDDAVVPRQVTTLALSFDHRHIDGQAGSAFLADVAAILRDPTQALFF